MNQERQVEAHADNDSRPTLYWQEWEIAGREIRSVLCVGTGIELRPGEPGFSKAELHKLMAEAQNMMRVAAYPIDLIRIVPDTRASPELHR